MRPDRAGGHGLSTCHLGRRRALQAVLARFFRAPDRIGPEARLGNHPALSRVARVYLPATSIDAPTATRSFPAAVGSSCLRLQSHGAEHPNNEVRVDSTLAPVYNLSDQPGRGVPFNAGLGSLCLPI